MRNLKQKTVLIAALSAALLSGCAVGPDYRAPAASSVPAAFKEAPAGWKTAQPSDATLRGDWWEMFGDAELSRLEREAASGNQTVAQYVSRMNRMEALVKETGAAQLPSVSGGASGSRSRQARQTGNSGSLLGSLSWELDFWGKLRRQVAEQQALYEGSAADLANARLSVQATLARNYFQLRSLDERIALYEASIKAYEQNARVMRNKYEAGAVLKSDLTQAEQSLYQAKASKSGLEASRAAAEHAIAVLLGKAPAEVSITRRESALPAVPEVPAGVPSRLLERRPDIASAERSMAAANEEIGIAVAGYFPDLTLTGEAGYRAGSFSRFINASNFVWSLGLSATAPIFDAGKTSSRVAQARASYEESVASYRQKVLEAMQGVEDALSEARSLNSEIASSEAASRASSETARVKANQYREGMIDYTEVYAAETARLTSAQNVLSLRSDALQNAVTLIEALGGGWQGLPKEGAGVDAAGGESGRN